MHRDRLTADPAAARPVLRFETLGPLRVTAGGQPVPLGPPQQRALLAALLVEGGRPVPVPVLLDRLWDDDPPSTAVKSIQKYVSNLRRADRIETEGGYRLVLEPVEVDDQAFEAALRTAQDPALPAPSRLACVERALATWRGEPFADVVEARFLEPVRARLCETEQALQEERLSLLLDLGRVEQAASEALERMEQHPLRERLWRIRMAALAGSGRQADALAEYQRLRTILGEQLGLEPSKETADLERKILLQDAAVVPTKPIAGNLPAPASALVARADEIARLDVLLAESRLVSLVGTAGIGKTRLAVAAAGRAAPRFPHGAWFVSLGSISDPTAVASRVAEELGFNETPGATALDALVELLTPRRALLVLDNCEHVVWGVAEVVATLLRKAPEVTILVTSRQPLKVSGEKVVELIGLEVPPPGVPDDEAAGYPAVELLTTRAEEAGAPSELLAGQRGAVADIARQLDGVPLALELVAPRLRFMDAADLCRELTTHLSSLVSDRRDVPERQRTIEAAIDWSFQLLDEDERRLLARLSVFRGGFTYDAAVDVCGWDLDDPSGAFAALVEHSLVTPYPAPGPRPRYQVLWVIGLFAATRLGDDAARTRQRHADHFLRLVEPPDRTPLPLPRVPMTELHREHANLRAALGHLLASGDAVTGLRLAAALGTFWTRNGMLTEAQTWLNRLLAAAPGASPSLKARALIALTGAYQPTSSDLALVAAEASRSEAEHTGNRCMVAAASATIGRIHAIRLEREQARPLLEEALATFDENEERRGMALCHEALALVHRGTPAELDHHRTAVAHLRAIGARIDLAHALFSMAYRALIPRGRFAEAGAAVEESHALAEEAGAREVLVHAQTSRGQLARLEGRLDEATAVLSEALDAVREFGDRRCTVRMLTALARVDLVRGDLDASWDHLCDAARVGIELDRGLSFDAHELVDAIALLALGRGDLPGAARCLGAAEALRSAQGLLRPPPDQDAFDRARREVEGALSADGTGQLLAEGATMPLEDLGVVLGTLRPAR